MHVLANWLLQGIVLVAATTLLLRLVPRLSATTRYRVWWVAMATLLWIAAVVLVIAGIIALVQGAIILGIVLIILGLLIGPGGVSIFT